VLDVVECDMAEEQEGVVDWVAAFPPEPTNLESLSFECYEPPVAFAALEALVARSPFLSRLGVNLHVSLGQLRRLMAVAPSLSHLGTGSFRPAEGGEEGTGFGEVVNAFVSAGRARTLVSLSGFRDLAQEYLPTIAVVCAHLKSLDLSYAAVTPNQILMFIGQCYNLETLWVLDCFLDLFCLFFVLCFADEDLFARYLTRCATKGSSPWEFLARSSSLFVCSH
jgi:hypothetical protein